MKKKVLITVSGGVPTAFAEPGVDVVIVDFDDLKDIEPKDRIPIRSDFLSLMEFACATDTWPTTDDGRQSDAYYKGSFESDLEVTLSFKPLTEPEQPPVGAPVFCLLKPGHIKKLIGDKPIVLFLTTDGYFSGSGLPFIVQPEEIDQWALVPPVLGGSHAA